MAEVAGPPSPWKPGAPVPATVLMMSASAAACVHAHAMHKAHSMDAAVGRVTCRRAGAGWVSHRLYGGVPTCRDGEQQDDAVMGVALWVASAVVSGAVVSGAVVSDVGCVMAKTQAAM